MPTAIVGRTSERSLLDELLTDPAAGVRALMLEGEPGIGKTTLLEHLAGTARERGYTLLSVRPSRSEMDLSYVGLIELLEAVPQRVLDGVPGPQARLLSMVLRREEPSAAFDRLSLGVATSAAVRALAGDAPVLLTVDDAQWLDPATARLLLFVLRRLGGGPVRLALAVRVGEAVGWRAEVERAVPEGAYRAERLGPIEPGDLSRVLRRTLGWAPAWPRVLRIWEMSAGNPLHGIEIARALGATGTPEDAASLPATALELARARIGRLPPRVREVLQLASVARAPTVGLLSRLDPTPLELRHALAVAQRNGVVSVDGERVRLAHPILAAAVYESMSEQRRRELHRAVAVLVDDAEERARHLAAAAPGPDPEVALALASAAEHAWRRGAPDAAAELMRLSCRHTPAGAEEVLALRRVAYGRLLYAAGDGPGAVEELEILAGELPPGLVRATALYHLTYVTRLSGDLGRAVEHGVLAAADAEADPVLQAEVYELLSRISDDDVVRKLDTARRAAEALDRADDPHPQVVFDVRAALVEAEFFAGLGNHVDRLLGLDPSTRPRFPPLRAATGGDDLIGRLLATSGRVEEGIAVLRALYERAAVASRSTLPAILGWIAEAELVAGRFGEVVALTGEAVERARENGADDAPPWEVGFHAVGLALLGRLDEADAAAARVVGTARPGAEVGIEHGPAVLALGLVAAARGRYATALAHLRWIDEAKSRAGIGEPAVCAHVADLIEVLAAAGETAEAYAVLSRFEEQAERTGGGWARTAAARCRALVLAADSRPDAARTAAELAVRLAAALPMPFEQGKAQLMLGQVYRRCRRKREAREALIRALTIFEQLPAPVWAERARGELARIPERHPAEGLTPTEETIARLAAAGLTNREIADRAFISPKTVEVNLTRIYRKLSVRSRAGLAGKVALGESPATRGGNP